MVVVGLGCGACVVLLSVLFCRPSILVSLWLTYDKKCKLSHQMSKSQLSGINDLSHTVAGCGIPSPPTQIKKKKKNMNADLAKLNTYLLNKINDLIDHNYIKDLTPKKLSVAMPAA